MRNRLFSIAYWTMSGFYATAAAVAALAPGRGPISFVLRLYTRRMLWAMRAFAGIEVQVKGTERLPPGPFILAAKHHSWGDGFVYFAHVDNLAFVTGDHLEKIPLLKGVLKKFGAIVVNNCGGPEARKALSDSAAAAHRDGRRILIFPEGHLAAPGERFRYRTGVFHMHKDFGLPVVPAATNLGCFWRQQAYEKTPGVATVEFLEPLPMGLDRAEFMARLEEVIETRTNDLIAETGRTTPRPAMLVEWDEARRVNVPAAS